MTMRFMEPAAALRLLELAGKPYRPPQILRLQKEIETRTRAAEKRLSITETVDEVEVRVIVEMKLELDRLYALWAEGKLEGEA